MNKEFSEKNYSVSTFWDKRAGRIMLSINLNRTRFSLSIHLYCSQSDYLKAKSGRMLTSEQKKLRDRIYSCVLKAEELLSRLNEPTKESFIKFYKSDLNLSSGSKVDCFALLQAKFVELESEERFGSAKSYLHYSIF
jgi:hypothetical protein